MDILEIVYANYNVTCETENCSNGEIELKIQAPKENPYIVCGVCGIQITKISPTK
jgi:hypothetical protein